MSLFTKLVDRIFAAGGALVFMQAPQFVQNYTQNLSGHLAELNFQLAQLNNLAGSSGKTVMDLSAKFLKNDDPDVVFQGEMLKGLVERQQFFQDAFMSLSHATPLSRPFIFFRHMDFQLTQETAHQFQMGLPLTIEGFIWGLIGLFAGYFIFRLLSRLARLFKSKPTSNPPNTLAKLN